MMSMIVPIDILASVCSSFSPHHEMSIICGLIVARMSMADP